MAHGFTSNRFVSKTNRIIAVVCAVLIVAISAALAMHARDSLGIVIALIGCVWLLFVVYVGLWRPRLDISDHAVTIVNPLRTIGVPLASLIHVDTKYSLTLFTEFGRFAVACAPQPGMFAARRAAKRTSEEPSARAALDSGDRIGDIRGTESGDAAALVRDRWDRYRHAQGQNLPASDEFRPAKRLHVASIAITAALPVLIVILSVLPR